MKIVKLYDVNLSNPYMAAEMDDGSILCVHTDSSCKHLIVGRPINKMGVQKSMLLPISAGTMRMVYQPMIDEYNREHEGVVSFRGLRQASGMTQKDFASYFGIPKRTVEEWDTGERACASYLLSLIEYKLKKEGLIGDQPDN